MEAKLLIRVRNLSIILQDVDITLSEQEFDDKRNNSLLDIAKSCRSVLEDLENALSRYSELSFKQTTINQRAKRVWKRLTWEPNGICDIRSRVTSNIVSLNAFNQNLANKNVAKLLSKQGDQNRREILDWLTPIDYSSQQADFISRRQPGTGRWLLSSPEYERWVKYKKRTLFCPGIPGAGKTILASIVVDHLSSRFQNDSTVCIVCLYCNFRQQSEQNAIDLKLSLVKQLAEGLSPFPNAVKELFDRHESEKTRPSEDEVLSILRKIASDHSKIFIIVDALDECQASNHCRTKLLSCIFNLQDQQNVNILVTSRHLPDIEEIFAKCPKLEICASRDDVRRYLESRMDELPPFVLRSPEIRSEIISTISEAADGMFLLAQIYFGFLDDKTSAKAIKAALKEFKRNGDLDKDNRMRTLTNAYGQTMERINGQKQGHKNLAMQVLLWITCAKRPLAPLELQYALAVEIGEKELDEDNFPEIEQMVSVCAGLVTIDRGTNIIRLVHYTAQEYFEKMQSQWFPEAQLIITKVCVTYLSFPRFAVAHYEKDDDFGATEDFTLDWKLESVPLYHYAATNWGYHAYGIPVCQEVISFLKNRAQIAAASRVALEGGRVYRRPAAGEVRIYLKKVTGLHLAAYFGLEDSVRHIMGEYGLDEDDSRGQTPSSWAAENGCEAIVRLLLEAGAGIESKSRTRGQTPYP
ncbi:uncharacterized protein F4822DRAFT_189027 [Hypoxylon trugodes]|uniref:uncharacterized protein n=1 Tax=Hypoxylon trugodes TaxID=326681 RepID=UPI0021A07FE8|nr:uncharacterized protein F4822DRAFT_189027 [Hypoxylon trugodes]KAI1391548.1 hypothetical protein F4822DRAFT_189027 [Hypoxylon trugodes]